MTTHIRPRRAHRSKPLLALLAFATIAAACSADSGELATDTAIEPAVEVLGEAELSEDNTITTTSTSTSSTTTSTTASSTTDAPATTATSAAPESSTTDAPETASTSTPPTSTAPTTTVALTSTTQPPTTTASTTTTEATTTTTETTTTTSTTAAPPLPNSGALFASNCARCHGATGEGGRGPNLQSLTNVNIAVAAVNNGPGGMPSFSGRLSPDEIAAVANFVVNGL